jgi:hypothetical protein
MSGSLAWADAVSAGRVAIDGSVDHVASVLRVFDHPSLGR